MDYIKLSRKLLEWEWWGDINTSRVFIYMLIKANWKEGKFKGKTVPRGSFVSSISNLADGTSLTIREVRTAISHLKSTGEVTSKSYSKYSVFTVNNYDLYQSNDTQNDRQVTSNRQANDILTTTIEEYKEIYDDDVIYARAMLTEFWGAAVTDFDVQTALEKMRSFDGERMSVDERKIGLLKYALVNSTYTGQRNWKYISGILKRLKDRGIDTAQQAEEYDAERDIKKI